MLMMRLIRPWYCSTLKVSEPSEELRYDDDNRLASAGSSAVDKQKTPHDCNGWRRVDDPNMARGCCGNCVAGLLRLEREPVNVIL